MKILKSKLIVSIVAIIGYMLFLFLLDGTPANIERSIYFLSLFGWILWWFVLVTWKGMTRELFSMYTIFVSFLLIFNFGQCFMWALGIHIPKEIGQYTSIPGMVISSDETIYRIQLITLMSVLAYHFGAIIVNKGVQSKEINNDYVIKNNDFVNSKYSESSLLKNICIFTLIISTISTYTVWISNLLINRALGYGAYLYDTEAVLERSNFLTLISWMFLPSIIGLLISTNFSKKITYTCFILFAVYALICSLAGYRSWIYEIVVLFWLTTSFNRKLNIKKMVLGGFLLFCILVLANALREARQWGVSWEVINDAIIGEANPIVAAFFEMGWSMQIGTIILSDSNFNYPYGNTYLLAIPGMITDRIIQFFIPSYVSIGGWFSQVYLGLVGTGAGFSMIAESIVNYGIYGAPIWMAVLGMIMSKFIFSKKINDRIIWLFFSISSYTMLLPIVRNTFLSTMKRWTFSVLPIIILFFVLKSFKRKNNL